MSKRQKIEEDSMERAAPAGEPLHLKYRPKRLKDVIGQDAVVKSLEATLKASGTLPHCYLFTGPAGTGKTSLARILADRLDVPSSGIIEVDAASNSGIDDMRRVTEGLRYNGFGETPNKAIILNECQGLSKQAWESLLTTTEEPPPHAYFIFTSTNPEKIPKAIVTRSQAYHLKPLGFDDVMDVLEWVCEDEGYKTGEKILAAVARACDGSMRAALTSLKTVHDCEDEKEAAILLQRPAEDAEIIELCRAMLKNDLDFPQACSLLSKMDEQGVQPESIRLVIVNYLNKCILGHRSAKDAQRLLDLQSFFLKPATGPEKMAPLLQAFGRVIYG